MIEKLIEYGIIIERGDYSMFLIDSIDPLVKLFNWEWLVDLGLGTIILRMLLAVLVGGILGVERSTNHHAAGFRTYIIVCLGSTVAMMTNEFMAKSSLSTDAARIGAQVISGIGFLGAGTILITSRNQIKGLTTAAGLWGCACLGLAIGVGYYTLGIIGVIVLILVLTILPKIEMSLTKKSRRFSIHIEFQCRENLKEFVNFVRTQEIRIDTIEHNPAYSASGLSVYTISLTVLKKGRVDHQAILKSFFAFDFVNFVEEIF